MKTTKQTTARKTNKVPTWDELREMFKETDKKIAETDRLIKEHSKIIFGISESNGMYAEDYFYNVFKEDPTLGKMHFDDVQRNRVFKGLQGENAEYDIVMLNDKNIAIIETKYRARDSDVDQVLDHAVSFRRWFPQYKKHKVYLGLASMNIRESTAAKARKRGIAVIRQRGGKLVYSDDNLIAF